VVVALVLFCWSGLAEATLGNSLAIGPIQYSTRNPSNPELLALLLTMAAGALAPAHERRSRLFQDLRWVGSGARSRLRSLWVMWANFTVWLECVPAIVAPMMALSFAAAILLTAVTHAQFVAASSDAWGYVSQAHMWATGTLQTPEPLMARLSNVLPREAVAPLAYRPSPDGSGIVPVTSPGLPMIMAIFEIAGGRDAVFAVVPLLAALAVWATYLLGRNCSGRWIGVMAAGLLATSPAFLFQLTSAPMSDIPATTFWALSIASALRGRGAWSGIAAGIAILIRANLVPVVIVPAAILAMNRTPPAKPSREALLFASGVLPAAIVIATLYTYWYGSPLNSGYGSLGQIYSAANVLPNLTRYSSWLLESQTPVLLVSLLAVAVTGDRRTAVALLMFVGGVIACYVFYLPFDAWWFLRFLLPAFPAMFVLTAAGLAAVVRVLPSQLRVAAILTALAVVANHTVTYAAARATFDSGGEQKYAITGRYIAGRLPANAVVLSEIHSGSIRYYAQRSTIRFGSIPSDHLEPALAELQRLGYQPYLVAEDWEEEVFRRQFAGRAILAALNDGPEAELPLGHVRIYRLAR
jgi:hypothetical protein